MGPLVGQEIIFAMMCKRNLSIKSWSSSLYEACRMGHLVVVKRIYEKHPELSKDAKLFSSCFWAACKKARLEIMTWFFDVVPPTNRCSIIGIAFKKRVSSKTLIWMLRSDHFDSPCYRVLIFKRACEFRCQKVLSMIPEYSNRFREIDRERLIIAACQFGAHEIIKHLLVDGDDFGPMPRIIITPIRNGSPEILATTCKLYPELVARVFASRLDRVVDDLNYDQLKTVHEIYPFMSTDREVANVLTWALSAAKVDTVDRICHDYPDILRSDPVARMQAITNGFGAKNIFYYACKGGNLAIAQKLWEYHADQIKKGYDVQRLTCNIASRYSRFDVVVWLAEVMPHINRTRDNGSHFQSACRNNSVRMLDRLAAHDPDLLVRTDLQEAFFIACAKNATDAMRWLLDHTDQIDVCAINERAFRAIYRLDGKARRMLVDLTMFSGTAKYCIYDGMCYLIGQALPDPPHQHDHVINGITVRPGRRVSIKRATAALESIRVLKRATSSN